MIPDRHQDISEADILAVEEVLRSNWLTQGPAVERFERVVSDYCAVPYALAVSNATAALHLACRSVGLGPGDVLWTSPNTFVASANCARYCGAEVDFVDIDPGTYNISPDQLRKKLEQAETHGRLPKVVMPVHFAGQPCEMAEIRELADRYKFYVIEDASHALGARYLDSIVGSCAFSDITVFSFHPVKIITTGEGGMTLTRNRDLHEKMKLLRSHGITRDPGNMTNPTEGGWYYQQIDLGYNYRMTDFQAALGASQMQRLDTFVSRRNELAERYDKKIEGMPVIRQRRQSSGYSAFHLYVIRVPPSGAKNRRDTAFVALQRAGVAVNVHYIPVHTQPYYRSLGFRAGDFPAAEQYYAEALSLPLCYGLLDSDVDRIVDALADSL